MKFVEFEKAMRGYAMFSNRDILKRFPSFDNRRLVEWQQKGYLDKVRRGFYCFTDSIKDEHLLLFTANKIYPPSYVSFESALAYYNFIPEGVFTTTSTTTKNTVGYETKFGNFTYRYVKPRLFFGYRLVEKNGITIKIAEPEKVVLDYFYLNTLDSIETIEEMRFNETQVKAIIDFEKLELYQNMFGKRVLKKRISQFKKVINA